jgi:hypothetical protein
VLPIVTFCDYCTEPPYAQQDSFYSNKLVKAVKGNPVKGWAEIPVPIGGSRRRLEQSNCGDVFGWFAEMAERHFPAGNVVLVPIPSSKAISPDEVRSGAPFRLARALAERRPAAIHVRLWWKTPMESAHTGGARDPRYLLSNLVVASKPSSRSPIVLVDDVCTSGGHLQAAEAGLRNAGCRVVMAICVAQSEKTESEEIFRVKTRKVSRVA